MCDLVGGDSGLKPWSLPWKESSFPLPVCRPQSPAAAAGTRFIIAGATPLKLTEQENNPRLHLEKQSASKRHFLSTFSTSSRWSGCLMTDDGDCGGGRLARAWSAHHHHQLAGSRVSTGQTGVRLFTPSLCSGVKVDQQGAEFSCASVSPEHLERPLVADCSKSITSASSR